VLFSDLGNVVLEYAQVSDTFRVDDDVEAMLVRA
jgi:hypothetical protein